MRLIIFRNSEGHIMQTVETEQPEIWLAEVLPRIPSDWTHEVADFEPTAGEVL